MTQAECPSILSCVEAFGIILVLGAVAVGLVTQAGTKRRLLNEWKTSAIKLGYSFLSGPRSGRTVEGSRWDQEMFYRYPDGSEIYLGVRSEEGSEHVTYFTYVELFFPRPLRTVLGVVNQKPGIIEMLSGVRDIQLFNKEADDALRIYGKDSDEIRALLTDSVQSKLVTLMKVYTVDLNTISVSLEIPNQRVTDVERLQPMTVFVQQLATEVLASQAQMPVSSHAQVLHCWSEIAAKYQCDYIVANHKIHRRTANWRVEVFDQLASPCWFTTLSVQMLTALPEFKIEVANSMAKLKRLFSSQDIGLGDASFDEYFIVSGRDPSQVREILGQDARKSLFELAIGAGSAIAHFHCSQAGLTIVLNCSLYNKEHLDWTMERLVRFATTLVKHHELPTAGPFR